MRCNHLRSMLGDGFTGNRSKRCERLALFGVTTEQLTRMRCPVGLNLGAKMPAEIPVSILAEMTALRYSIPVVQRHVLNASGHRPTDSVA